MKFNRHVEPIDNNVQDRHSDAWKALCRYIDELADSGAREFNPREALGPELYAGIFTLPESIGKLKQVTNIMLYGSKLKRIPPEIGEMSALEDLDVYTSRSLQWLPYELVHCRNLTKSRASTRHLYGNFKNRLHFPWLKHNPVRYHGDTLKCSVCGREITYDKTLQLWISLRLGTDTFPLLVNSCSRQCTESLPPPRENYVSHPHRGGTSVEQPPTYDVLFDEAVKLARQKRVQERAAARPAGFVGPDEEDSEPVRVSIKL